MFTISTALFKLLWRTQVLTSTVEHYMDLLNFSSKMGHCKPFDKEVGIVLHGSVGDQWGDID